MIDELAVSNLGVIEQAHLEPGSGFVVVSGETGAGKTLLLGALRLLVGTPAGGDQVGPAGDEARVDGRFHVGGEEIVAGRRLVREGRSRAYLDGAMAPARALEERAGALVEIVGQHDPLALGRPREVRLMLDRSLDRAGTRARATYDEAYERLAELRAAQEALGGDRRMLERELDLARFQAEEIGAAGFASGDEEALRTRATRLRNAEALAEHLAAALRALEEDEAAAVALDQLTKAARLDGTLSPASDQAATLVADVTELAGSIRRAVAHLEHDPGELASLEARLATLGDLERKYGTTLDEVLAFGAAAASRTAELETLLERADGLDAELGVAVAAVEDAGVELRAARAAAAKRLSSAAVEHLRELGFRDPVVHFDIAPAEPSASGADSVALEFASDSALTPGPVGKVASGGELSRLVLALRLAGGAGEAPVVAFDEIDAGVGGATALALGRKLAALAEDRQILCVTHLPQVAAFAATHYVVDRDGTTATVRRVDGTDRVAELSRMLSGLPESERGRDHAEELLALAGES